MMAASVRSDLLFVAHVMGMVASLVVLVTMRRSAADASRGLTDAVRARLPKGRNWAARLFHVAALSGLALSLAGDADQSLRHAWVQVGATAYLVAAGVLEAVVLPAERRARDESVVSPWWGRGLDVVLTCVAIATVAMLVQF